MLDRSQVYGRGALEWIKEDPGECIARLRINLPIGRDGKRQRKRFTLRGRTRREIEKERIKILSELNKGTLVGLPTYQDPSIPLATSSLAEFCQYWLEHVVDGRTLAKRTRECYRDYLNYYVVPDLGEVQLGKLTRGMIQSFYGRLRISGRRRSQKSGSISGLSPTTICNLHRVFHRVLDWAVKWEILAANPADHVAVPRPTYRKPNILSGEQIQHLLDACDNPRLKLFVSIAICTGMRRGEVLGLKWSDVNLQEGVLAIQHNLVDTGREVVLGRPKTDESSRPIKIPHMLQLILQDQRTAQAVLKSTLGSAYQDHDLVLCWEDGRPIHPHRFYRPLANLLKRLGLPECVKLHDLRHSHATALLQANIHPKIVSERLGHKDVETTLNIYSHVLPNMQQEAADATDRLFGGAEIRNIGFGTAQAKDHHYSGDE